jgi:serine protease Do
LESGRDGEAGPFGDLFRNEPGLRDFFRFRSPLPFPRTQGHASGFIIDRSGVILTNNHVVADAEQVKVKLSDGREYVATGVKGDARSDVAILRIKAEGELVPLRLGNSDAVDIGEWVLAVGSPFGLDLTVTAGIISAKGRGMGIAEREDFLQTDAAINPGNSGGPLINLDGEVIGMSSAIASRSGGYEGIGFAVPINLARWVADQLTSKGSVTRAYLGVMAQQVDQELARQFKIPVGRGAIVTQVTPGSPAAAAKLEAGDVILRVDGKAVNGSRELQGLVEKLHIGRKYPLIVLRHGKELHVDLEVKEMPREYTLAGAHDSEGPETVEPGKFGDLGLDVADLTAEAARQLGYKEATGVAITSVKPDSPAAAAGLHDGMLIEKVGQRRVTTVAEFREALKEVSLEKGVLLLVRSPRGSQFVVLRQGAP